MTTLVLLPGLDGTGVLFEPLIHALAGRASTVPMSYPQDHHLSYDRLVDYVLEAVPKDDWFLLAESYSGPIAVMLASRQPEGLRGLILCATFISNPSFHIPAFMSFFIRSPLFFMWPVSMKLAFFTSWKKAQPLQPLMARAKAKVKNGVLAARTRETLHVDVTDEFASCRYPMLYLRGDRDIVVPESNLRQMRLLRKDMECSIFPTSHMVLQEAPCETAREIERFIGKNTSHNQAL